jgi:hemerythrin-like metal-binding protein
MSSEHDAIPGIQVDFGIPSMDDSHHQLLAELDEIAKANDQEFAHWYPQLIAAMEQDFRVEEGMMEACNLRSWQAHMEQHARMLAGLHAAVSSVESGDLLSGREAVGLLRQWLPFHIATMDRELAEQARAVQDTPSP